ncbi:MAG: MFS transporter [Candidatus Nanoarchaeia archaeon]|nr:MFS transporter [Candidatus Nanoarchaeia archaeon]
MRIKNSRRFSEYKKNASEALRLLKHDFIKYLLIAICIDWFAFSVVSPIKSIYINSFGIDFFHIGILYAVSIVFNILLDTPFGTLSDQIRRKKMITVSLIAKSVLYFLFTTASDFNSFIVIFILSGITEAAFMVSMWSYMTDALRKIKGNYTIISIIWTIPGIIGYYIGGFLGEIDNRFSFYLASLILLFAIFSSVKIPHMNKKEGTLKDGLEEMFKGAYADEIKSFVKSKRNVKIASFIDFIINYDGYIYYTFIPLYLNSIFGLSEFWVGVFFSVMDLVFVSVRAFENVIFTKLRKRRTIIVSAFGAGLIYLCLPFITSIELFITVIVTASVLIWMIFPLSYHIFIRSLPRRKRGEIIGVNHAISDSGGVAGELIGGLVADSFGIPYAYATTGLLYISASVASAFMNKTSKKGFIKEMRERKRAIKKGKPYIP